MHRALLIVEVARIIAFQQSNKGDLVSLAQSCRALSEPALDALWAELEDVTPLFECLPDDLIFCDDFESSIQYSLRRPFTLDDWKIFRKYASRIAELHLKFPERFIKGRQVGQALIIDTNIYHALSCPPTFKPLFSKLRRLSMIVQPAELSFLRLLLGPSIESLTLYPYSFDNHLLSLTATLGIICPHMKEFNWISVRPSETEATVLSQLVMSWPKLEAVASCSLNKDALQHLSSLPSLEALTAGLWHIPTHPGGLILPKPAFSNVSFIKFLSPTGHTLSSVASVVESFRASPTEFSATAQTARPTAVSDLFEAISGHLDKAKLERLYVYEEGSGDDLTLDKSTFEHVFQFRHLTEIYVNTYREVDLDGRDLLEMADAWPNLVSFGINDGRGWRRRSSVTLHDVRAMLQRLPELESLIVAVDCQTLEIDTLADDQYGKFRVSRPFQLDLLDSRIGRNLADIAAFLSDLFPEIDEDSLTCWSLSSEALEFMQETYEVHSRRWDDVRDIVLTMNQVRKLESRGVGELAG